MPCHNISNNLKNMEHPDLQSLPPELVASGKLVYP
jgi:hypothetical protein